MMIMSEIIRNSPTVNIAVVSLSNVHPPKPLQPPPQYSGAKNIHIAEIAIKNIANFFHVLNICFLRNRRVRSNSKRARENANNDVPSGLNILFVYIYTTTKAKVKILIIIYRL